MSAKESIELSPEDLRVLQEAGFQELKEQPISDYYNPHSDICEVDF